MLKKQLFIFMITIVTIGAVSACMSDGANASVKLKDIAYFMYQIQGLEDKSSIDLLASKPYDMLIVEPGFNIKDDPYDTAYLVKTLKRKPNGTPRLLLAYVDIGQAEDYRTYWQEDWIAPTKTQPGVPNFLRTVDPDGWSGNYPVAYWEPAWQAIWLDKDGLIEQMARQGFDGVYLDWVEAYDDDAVRTYAQSQGVEPEKAMMLLIDHIRKKGKSINPNFLVMVQNAPYLLDANASYYTSIIDAVSNEDTWFYGEGDAEWSDPNAGDLVNGARQDDTYSTESRIKQYKKYLARDIPVFTVDYCIKSSHAKTVYKYARENGFVPLVTRVSLSKITETPPF